MHLNAFFHPSGSGCHLGEATCLVLSSKLGTCGSWRLTHGCFPVLCCRRSCAHGGQSLPCWGWGARAASPALPALPVRLAYPPFPLMPGDHFLCLADALLSLARPPSPITRVCRAQGCRGAELCQPQQCNTDLCVPQRPALGSLRWQCRFAARLPAPQAAVGGFWFGRAA